MRNISFVLLIGVTLSILSYGSYYYIYPIYNNSNNATISLTGTTQGVIVENSNTGTTGNTQSGITLPGTGGRLDKVVIMESTNSFFKEGIELSNNKNYTGAIEVLEQAKTLTKDVDQLAIIDFSISVSKFGIDPVIGVQSYLDLADNRLYPARTRALAMQRMYLSYVRSNDTDLFGVMRDWLSMSGASDSEIKLAFMKKAYEIYPLPGSMLYLMQVELASVNNRTDAITVYNKYQPKIDDGIKIMANSAGELIEATSAMLGSAQILGNLYRDYAISNRKEVESFYKNLIQFDQEKKITTNKQYSLVYYANFLADIGDNEGAQKVIKTFLEEEIRPVVREGLPKTKNLTGLRNMENITDPDIQSFIQFLGPTIQ